MDGRVDSWSFLVSQAREERDQLKKQLKEEKGLFQKNRYLFTNERASRIFQELQQKVAAELKGGEKPLPSATAPCCFAIAVNRTLLTGFDNMNLPPFSRWSVDDAKGFEVQSAQMMKYRNAIAGDLAKKLRELCQAWSAEFSKADRLKFDITAVDSFYEHKTSAVIIHIWFSKKYRLWPRPARARSADNDQSHAN